MSPETEAWARGRAGDCYTPRVVRDGHPTETLDRVAYAMARARGFAMHRAAKLAGSEAASVAALCHAASRMEAEPEVQEAIRLEREAIKAQTDRAWDRALEVMADDLEHPDGKVRRGAADFLARVGGRYQDKPVVDQRQVVLLGADAVQALQIAAGTETGRRGLTDGVARLIEGA